MQCQRPHDLDEEWPQSQFAIGSFADSSEGGNGQLDEITSAAPELRAQIHQADMKLVVIEFNPFGREGIHLFGILAQRFEDF